MAPLRSTKKQEPVFELGLKMKNQPKFKIQPNLPRSLLERVKNDNCGLTISTILSITDGKGRKNYNLIRLDLNLAEVLESDEEEWVDVDGANELQTLVSLPKSFQPGSSKQAENFQPGTSKQAENSQPGTSKRAENSQPGTSKQAENSQPGTSKQAENSQPGSSKQAESSSGSSSDAARRQLSSDVLIVGQTMVDKEFVHALEMEENRFMRAVIVNVVLNTEKDEERLANFKLPTYLSLLSPSTSAKEKIFDHVRVYFPLLTGEALEKCYEENLAIIKKM